MKKYLLFLLIPYFVLAQNTNDYIRSSIHLHLIDDFEFENGDYVLKSYQKFYNFHFPENYNNHSIDVNKVTLDNWKLTEKELVANNMKSSGLFKGLENSLNEKTSGFIDIRTDPALVKLQLDKYISKKKIAHKLVKKWFNVKDDGLFNTSYITMKTIQNETVKSAALNAAQDLETDVTNKLISNTFVVFTKLKYIDNKVLAEALRKLALSKIKKMKDGILKELAVESAEALYLSMKDGYSVIADAWLYQLEWSQANLEDLTSTFDLVDGVTKINFEKFDNINFSLKFLSNDKAMTLLAISDKEVTEINQEDVYDTSTIKSMNQVLFELQKDNDVFKPLFPLRDGFAIAAGTKEGLTGGEIFDVLEIKAGEYVSIGTMKIDKNRVWNNSFEPGKDIKPDFTYFKKGKKKFVPAIHYVRFKK